MHIEESFGVVSLSRPRGIYTRVIRVSRRVESVLECYMQGSLLSHVASSFECEMRVRAGTMTPADGGVYTTLN